MSVDHHEADVVPSGWRPNWARLAIVLAVAAMFVVVRTIGLIPPTLLYVLAGGGVPDLVL